MKNLVNSRLLLAVGAVILGVVLLIWPSGSLLIMAKLIGALVAVGGAGILILFFRDQSPLPVKSVMLVLGILLLVIGGMIFFNPKGLVELIPTIMGVFVLLSGIGNVAETITLSRNSYERWNLSLIFAVLTVALGLLLIFRPFGIAKLIVRIAGIALIFDGATDLWILTRIRKVVDFSEPIDVEAKDVDGK